MPNVEPATVVIKPPVRLDAHRADFCVIAVLGCLDTPSCRCTFGLLGSMIAHGSARHLLTKQDFSGTASIAIVRLFSEKSLSSALCPLRLALGEVVVQHVAV